MIFLLKLVKRRKHGIKCLFVYPVTEHIHDDRFKFAVKAVKQIVYRLSDGFGICVLLKVAELFPYLFIRTVIAIQLALTAGDRITEIERTLTESLLDRSDTDTACLRNL